MPERTDINDILLTKRASDVAQRFVEDKWFSYMYEAALFAGAYAIKEHFEDFKPLNYNILGDKNGSNFSYITFDPSGKIEKLIKILYDTDTPHLVLKHLMIYGLELIGDDIDATGSLEISHFI